MLLALYSLCCHFSLIFFFFLSFALHMRILETDKTLMENVYEDFYSPSLFLYSLLLFPTI